MTIRASLKPFGFVSVVVSLLVIQPSVRAQAPASPTSADGRYLVEFRQVGPAAVAAVRAAGGAAVHQFPDLNVVAAWLPAPAVQALRANPNVLTIEEDARRYPFGQVTPYGVAMVQAPQVDDTPAATRKVCVIDSGYFAHDDLQRSFVTATSNNGTGNPFTDKCGHGTHVAGTIAALDNADGVVGVVGSGALGLHIVKVFGDNCSWAYSSDLIAAAEACRVAGSHVISMSLGGSFKSRFEEQKFNQLYDAGLLSIAAAGNAGNTTYSYPASYNSVVSVAAIDSSRQLASFSQRNNQVELSAPGVGVVSTVPWLGSSVTVEGLKYLGSAIENAATTSGIDGLLANGGGCTSTGSWAGRVVLCERGVNSFFEKVKNVQNGGGVAAVIYNNQSGGFAGTLGSGNSSGIPAIGVSQEDGQQLVATALGRPGTVINSKDAGSGYEAWDGTSMATPHVSGVAALVWATTRAGAMQPFERRCSGLPWISGRPAATIRMATAWFRRRPRSIT